ncbi:PHD finger protein 10 [Petromyzon marinus]|uniref:PHD finger protein 10 n=1 Tax=Petromyzon marinus TaxID=7757 RepID=UPI003F709A3D
MAKVTSTGDARDDESVPQDVEMEEVNEVDPCKSMTSQESVIQKSGAWVSETQERGGHGAVTQEEEMQTSETQEARSQVGGPLEIGAEETTAPEAGAQQVLIQEVGALKTVTQEAGAQKTDTQEAGAQKTDTQEAGAQKTVTQEAGAQKTLTQEAGAQKTDTQEAGAQKTVTQEAGAQKTVTQEAGAQKTVTQEAGAQKTDTQEAGAQKTDTQEAGAQKTVTQEAGAQKTDTQEAGAQKTDTQEAGAQKTVTQEAGAQKIDTQEAGAQKTFTQEAGAQKTVTQEAGAQKTDTQEAGAQKTDTQEAGAQKTVTQEAGAQKTDTQEAGAQKTDTQEAGAQKTVTQEAGAQKTVTQEAGAQETGTRPTKRRRLGSGDSSRSSDTIQDVSSVCSGAFFLAEMLVEYKWPSDDGGEYYMLQEQISEYLGVTSFKRKYPDLERHDLSHKEKLHLRELNVITETQCTLGLTALRSDEVIDLLMKEYPTKYAEYVTVLQDRERQRITDRYKEYSQQQSNQKVEPGKAPEYMKKAVRKAAEYNLNLNRERLEERRAYFDLQTHTIQFPYGKYKAIAPDKTKVGSYPVALIPGQFQEYYKRYSASELRYLPVNTALYAPPLDPELPAPDSDGADSDDDGDGDTQGRRGDDSTSDSGTSSSSDGESPSDAAEEPAPPPRPGPGRPPKDPAAAAARLAQHKAVPGYKPKVVYNALCGICLKGRENNRKGKAESLVHCSQCENSGHPSCLDMSNELVAVIKTYPWQCMECKTCVVCGQPHHEEQLMFCDKCDRGYHTFCVGLDHIPMGRWNCATCEAKPVNPKKTAKRGKNGKDS